MICITAQVFGCLVVLWRAVVADKGSEDGTQSPRVCEEPREFFQCHSQAYAGNTQQVNVSTQSRTDSH